MKGPKMTKKIRFNKIKKMSMAQINCFQKESEKLGCNARRARDRAELNKNYSSDAPSSGPELDNNCANDRLGNCANDRLGKESEFNEIYTTDRADQSTEWNKAYLSGVEEVDLSDTAHHDTTRTECISHKKKNITMTLFVPTSRNSVLFKLICV